ncbi:hypothetical protein U729_3255 (plasmid) [Clostridium baratii str. Sullivan]|uniref:Uncharacterized protein n=1 Tax=Clostridium baratii str. Sullivan TaxID=1415775 RepID=A0A0A7G2X9_9CLOT|nr:hypothetical protein [Clostridium baratii]AIY85370.1 hypothetical protein U729_3255 [Clostridium baratii str. Sullivan]
MQRYSLSLWNDFKKKLEELAVRLSVDTILVDTVDSIIEKVERAIALEEPYSELLEELEILEDTSYIQHMSMKVTKEDIEFMKETFDDYVILANYAKKEDNIIMEEKEFNSKVEVREGSKNLPKNEELDFHDIYNNKDKGEKDYLY